MPSKGSVGHGAAVHRDADGTADRHDQGTEEEPDPPLCFPNGNRCRKKDDGDDEDHDGRTGRGFGISV